MYKETTVYPPLQYAQYTLAAEKFEGIDGKELFILYHLGVIFTDEVTKTEVKEHVQDHTVIQEWRLVLNQGLHGSCCGPSF